jgi:cytoskeletal protein CcmA (bactofilin family)
MWSKQPTQTGSTGYSPAPSQPSAPSASSSSSFNSAPSARPSTVPSSPSARNLACLGETVEVKGRISGSEDLQIDGKEEGPVALEGQRLTVGRTGQLQTEINARVVVVYGKVSGNLHAKDRVEIKKDGSVIGVINTARISIEDGAYFKGRIEIERTGSSSSASHSQSAELVGVEAN